MRCCVLALWCMFKSKFGPYRHGHALRLGGVDDFLNVQEGGELEERLLLHLVAIGADKVVDGPDLARQGAPDAGLATDREGAGVRAPGRARGHRCAVFAVRHDRERPARVFGLCLPTKRRAGHNVCATLGIRKDVVILHVIVFHVIVASARLALVTLGPRLVFVVVVVVGDGATARIVPLGGGARMCRARAHRRRAVELLASALFQYGHRYGPKTPAIRNGRRRLAAATAAPRRALPERVLRTGGRRRRARRRARRRRRGDRVARRGRRHRLVLARRRVVVRGVHDWCRCARTCASERVPGNGAY